MKKIFYTTATAVLLFAVLATWSAWAVYAHHAADLCGLDLPTCAERAGYPFGGK